MSEKHRSINLEMISLHKFLFVFFSFAVIYKFYDPVPQVVVSINDPKFELLGPYNGSKGPINDDYQRLIDIKPFKFLVNPQPCEDYPAGILLVIIVSSNPRNYKNRMLIRNTWGRNVDSTRVVFLFGESQSADVANWINREVRRYGDIVQGNFLDVYRNMTYKHVMGLKWVSHHCPQAKYILKTDDDVAVNSQELRHLIAREMSPWGAENLIACQVLENAEVQRTGSSKWKVSKDEYLGDHYPNYCAGWAILYSQDVVRRLLEAAQSTHYFWVDDVHVTGVLAEKLGIPRTSFRSLMLPRFKLKLMKLLGPNSSGHFIFGPPDLTLGEIRVIWDACNKTESE